MDLRVFFYRKFVVGQGRERSIAREFLEKNEKKSIIEICPIRNVVARFGNKWALLVVFILNENGSTRFTT